MAIWGEHPRDVFGAWHAWKAARADWATTQGLDLSQDYRHLPPELRDRAPYSHHEG